MSASAAKPAVERQYHNADTPYVLASDNVEWKRLDDLHNTFKQYFGGKNDLAPIEDPKAILDLGAGSGIWVDEMATKYPKAKVIAVDISQPNPIRIKSNCTVMQVNLAKDWPFEPESFDVIHARLLLMHVPNFPELVNKCVAALRPGGFLLLEDIDHFIKSAEGDVPPGIKQFYDIYHGHMTSNGADAEAGSHLEPVVRATGAFKEINVHYFFAPMTPWGPNERLNDLGRGGRLTLERAYSTLYTNPKLEERGLTKEICDKWVEEARDPQYKLKMDIYWLWAQKA